MPLIIARDMQALQEALTELVKAGRRVALVPTMGALHAGHLALVEAAKTKADTVVVSIFVNPKQFDANEDLAKYPRTLEADLDKLHEAGVAIAYTPDDADMYPEGFTTTVSPGALGTELCGKSRPGHFDGVATVVTKLLLRVLPMVALFGEKDYQQLCIIRRLAADLDIPVDIEGVPIMREADGLALSSRNIYLSAGERTIAPKLYETLKRVADYIKHTMPLTEALNIGIERLTEAGFRMDYLELRDADTLDALDAFEPPARLLAAVWLGNTRLIDNIAVE